MILIFFLQILILIQGQYLSNVSTLAGNGSASFADGMSMGSKFNDPVDLDVDTAGNTYIADKNNHRIRKLTRGGVVSTLAGSGKASFADGTGTIASFDTPSGVVVDPAGNVYVADCYNSRIRKITPGGVVSTFYFWQPSYRCPKGLALDFMGNLWVSFKSQNYFCKIKPDRTLSDFSSDICSGKVIGLAVDNTGNIYFTETFSHRVCKMTPEGVISIIAGSGKGGFVNGLGELASFNNPQDVTVDTGGNIIVADSSNNCIRMVSPGGLVSTLSGSGRNTFGDGEGIGASFYFPTGVVSVGSGGNQKIYVADSLNNRVRVLSFSPCPAGNLCSNPISISTCPSGAYCPTGSFTSTPCKEVSIVCFFFFCTLQA